MAEIAHEDGAARGVGLTLVVLATACWSMSGIFISWVVEGSGISPLGLAFWRDVTTFACLLTGVVVLRPGLLRVARHDLPWLAAMGAISIGSFHVLWITSILLDGVALATVIQSNAPIFVTIVAWLLWGERLTKRKIAAIVLAVAGTALIARPDSTALIQITPIGLLAGIGAAITLGTLSLFAKKLNRDYHQVTTLTYAFGFAALALLPFQRGHAIPPIINANVLAAFAGLILLPTLTGFALYTSGLQRLPASVAAIIATTEVPFAAVTAYLLLGERLDGWQALGTALVVGGVVLLARGRKRTGPAGRRVV